MKSLGRLVSLFCLPLTVFFLLSLVSCNQQPSSEDTTLSKEQDDGVYTIYSVNYPLHYFANRMIQDISDVEANFPVSSDVDPTEWTPVADQIRAFQSADLILLNGGEYAVWKTGVSLPSSALLDTSTKFKEDFIYTDYSHAHGSGADAHVHSVAVNTFWLSPKLAKQQAAAIHQKLLKDLPEAGLETLNSNYEKLIEDLDDLEILYAESRLSDESKVEVLSNYPFLDYTALDLNFEVKSIGWEADVIPSMMSFETLNSTISENGTTIMFFDRKPIDGLVDELEAINVEAIYLSPISNTPAEGDYISMMKSNLEILKLALER